MSFCLLRMRLLFLCWDFLQLACFSSLPFAVKKKQNKTKQNKNQKTKQTKNPEMVQKKVSAIV
ncbi:rCG55578 [Rattus norvegicus]|uniref:RCG55578 n=1 Tax=Rattus norvegicus TaxID=10116 RepID=A6JR99_RAT|nr:rCG55578 [Rattus norvegicus]